MSFAWSSDDLRVTNNNETSCAICKTTFGVRRRHRRRTCRRCEKKVCDNCCSRKRFDFKLKQLIRTCDDCLKNEYEIRISHRINNLKLISRRNKGIYIAKTLPFSREYRDGFVSNCRIIEINSTNVESFTAQQIANKLNIIKLPFKMGLDCTESEVSIHDLKQSLLQRKKSYKSMSVGIIMEPDSSSISYPQEAELRSNSTINSLNYNCTKSCPGSPVMDISFSYCDHEWDHDQDVKSEHDTQQKHNCNDDDITPHNDDPFTYHLAHASRQFCIVFEDRDDLKYLCFELRNKYHLYKNINANKHHHKTIHDIWGWYTVTKHDRNNIPIGCKLLCINGINMLNPSNWHKMDRYLSQCSLPIALIFEAPHYLKTMPRSQVMQYQYHNKQPLKHVQHDSNLNVFLWWIQDGGAVLIILALLAFIVFESLRAFMWKQLYLIIVSLLCIPNVASHVFHWLFIQRRPHNNNLNKTPIASAAFMVVNGHKLSLNHDHENKHRHKKHKRNSSKPETSAVIAPHNNNDKSIFEEKEKEEEEKKQQQQQLEDDDWERNLCHTNGNTEQWGSYCLGSSQLLHVRGAMYLKDKIKVESQQALFKIAHIEVFESHETIQCMAQNSCSWFHCNRDKLPNDLFFFIFHLRMDSLNCSIVIYWYCDKTRYKSLIDTNCAINKIAKEKAAGNEYFCVGAKGYDESGMFWNFINGECQYRNDRLKMIARKHEGSWYLHIPSTPAIIGKKIPIIYYRAYNKKELNAIKSDNSTNSEQYESYSFNTLCHQAGDNKSNNNKETVPCSCGRCYWIDTKGEYPEYIELHFNPEAASPIARNTIKIAAGVTKSLAWELHFLLEGQRNKIELPETVFANARISHINLDCMMPID